MCSMEHLLSESKHLELENRRLLFVLSSLKANTVVTLVTTCRRLEFRYNLLAIPVCFNSVT